MSQLPEQVWYERLSPAQQYSGIRGGMIAIGIVLICIGALFACTSAMMPLALAMQGNPAIAQNNPPVPHATRMMIGAAVLYLVMAGTVIFGAIGTLRCQRWARPVMIVISVLTLLTGIGALFVFAVGYPDFIRQMNQAGGPPSSAAPIIFGSTVGFLFLFMVVLPGIFLWFFARARVAEALILLDPNPRWTDGVPLPVLGISLTLGILGSTALISAIFAQAPQFGTMIVGAAASILLLAEGSLEMVLAWATFREIRRFWWAALGYVIFYSIALGSTAIRSDKLALYRRAGYTERQLQQMSQFSALRGPMAAITFAIFTILAVGYLLYARRYFGQKAQASAATAGHVINS